MKNKFSLRKHFKDTYSTACIIPTVALLLIGLVLLVLAYSKGLLSLQWLLILAISLTVVAILVEIWFILKTLKELAQEDKTKQIVECRHCSLDYKKYIFNRHGLITLTDIIELEKRLKDHPEANQCEVLNFTTLSDTYNSYDEKAEQMQDIILQNRANGVRYRVVYSSEDFKTKRNVEIYGEESLKKHSIKTIFENLDFDYLIHKTPESIECYVAVNFNSQQDNCGGCPRGSHCDYLNDYVFYRILPKYEAESVYRKIMKLFEAQV